MRGEPLADDFHLARENAPGLYLCPFIFERAMHRDMHAFLDRIELFDLIGAFIHIRLDHSDGVFNNARPSARTSGCQQVLGAMVIDGGKGCPAADSKFPDDGSQPLTGPGDYIVGA
ncbi:hypothetical protein N7510_008392 [Penicillium lagena]|uniref:uncharacterized protein n=1 Tax=Penicillium lagena TaxID=94218 RepID=UPI002542682A|nr:uncharacterized protein N7510_008392 [Penicillium lagena]KAJ5605611.1 hypothetical protein N7510_008392 [Penicillium lagena]